MNIVIESMVLEVLFNIHKSIPIIQMYVFYFVWFLCGISQVGFGK